MVHPTLCSVPALLVIMQACNLPLLAGRLAFFCQLCIQRLRAGRKQTGTSMGACPGGTAGMHVIGVLHAELMGTCLQRTHHDIAGCLEAWPASSHRMSGCYHRQVDSEVSRILSEAYARVTSLLVRPCTWALLWSSLYCSTGVPGPQPDGWEVPSSGANAAWLWAGIQRTMCVVLGAPFSSIPWDPAWVQPASRACSSVARLHMFQTPATAVSAARPSPCSACQVSGCWRLW